MKTGKTLYYYPEKPKPYELRKDGFEQGKKYTERGARSLIKTLVHQINGKIIKISPEAKEALEERIKTSN